MLYADQLTDFTRIQYLFKRNEIRGIPQDVANAYNTVPDLINPRLELALAVDLDWQAGLVIDVPIGD